MKRLFVTAALLPLALASAARGETKITTAVTTPVKTSTAANGAPDNLTIDTAGSVKPTTSGAAVTLDSNNTVTNNGAIGFNDVDGATGILALGGHTGSVINAGTISVTEDNAQPDTDNDGFADGPAAVGSTRYGIRVTGPGALTGNVRNDAAGAITVKGNDSAGISIETQLNGSLLSAGAVAMTGDRSVGIATQHVTGDVKITGSVSAAGDASRGVVLGDVDGAVQLQNAITATGYKTVTRLADADRAKLDADDLKQGGAAVSITGSVAKGILLDRPPTLDSTNTDVDGDGVPDASESTAVLSSFGAAPALDIGSATQATTIGMVGTGDNAYGLVNKGTITGQGVNDGVGATALRIGLPGGGVTTLAGGVNNNGGTISAVAWGAAVKAGGGDATAILVGPNAVVPAIVNSGTISATLNNGTQDARAIVDRSGSVTLVDNIGTISAINAPAVGSTLTGRTIAIDLSANTTGALVRQAQPNTFTPSITGDVLFGSGADTLQLSGGTLTGAVAFGAGADTLSIDGGAKLTGAITDSDGQLGVQVLNGRLAITNAAPLQISSLNVGAKGVLAFTLDPVAGTNTRLQVAGPAVLADGATVELSVASVLKTATSFQLISAASLQQGSVSAPLLGAPFMFSAALKSTPTTLSVDIRPKTAAELGLNRSGAQAYAAVLANLDRDQAVENAFLAQTTQSGFQGLYDQMLPDHSGGSLMSAHAISAAISQAVGQALPHDGRGGSAIWAQEIAFHLARDRDQALGYASQGYGLAAGVEAVGERNAVGLDGSFVTTTYNDRGAAVGERIVMNFAEAGAYWRLRAGAFQADARAGLGYVWFDSDRRLAGPNLAFSATANWGGWLVDAHAGASYDLRLGRFYARPEVSLDYIRLNEDGYQEAGGGAGFDLKVDSRNGDLLTGQALVAFGWQVGDDSWWAPELKLGWQQKLAGAPGSTTASFAGGTAFTLDPETPAASGVIARLGFKVGGDQVYLAVDGGGTFDKGSQEYDLRGTVRFRF